MDSTMIATAIEVVGPYLLEIVVTIVVGLLFPSLRRVLDQAEGKFGAERVRSLNNELGAAIRRGIAKAIAETSGQSTITIRDLTASYIERTKGDVLKGLDAKRDQLIGRIEAEMANGMDWLSDALQEKLSGASRGAIR